MSKIIRSANNVDGNVTVTNGDVVVAAEASGIVLTEAGGAQHRIRIGDDDGVKTIVIEEVP